MHFLFNWIVEKLDSERENLIEICISESASFTDPFWDLINEHQLSNITPEFVDLNLLLDDNFSLLFEVFEKVSLGKENEFKPLYIHQFVKNGILKELNLPSNYLVVDYLKDEFSKFNNSISSSSSSSSKSKLFQELIVWISNQQRLFWLYPPAFFYLEYCLEQIFISYSNFINEGQKKIIQKKLNYVNFESNFKLQRTRNIQLIIIKLIEKCMREI